jgi:hypothetical protein
VATPPVFRGGLTKGKTDLEIQLDELFPNSHIFLEKPVATGTPWDKSIEEAKQVGKVMGKHGGKVSIG